MGAENFAVVLVGEPDDLADVLPSWERYLRAANLSPRTVQSYLEAADQLLCHVGPVSAECLSRQHIGSYIEDVLAKHSAATAAVRYRSLQQLWVAHRRGRGTCRPDGGDEATARA